MKTSVPSSSDREDRTPSPPTTIVMSPPEVIQRKQSPTTLPLTEGKPPVTPRRSPVMERRSQCPIPGEESRPPPPISPRHSRVLRDSGLPGGRVQPETQPGRAKREPVGMETRPEPVGCPDESPPPPPPRRSTLASSGI